MANKGLKIISMRDPSEFGLDPSALAIGDRIVEVAGEKDTDQIDWHFYTAQDAPVSLKVLHESGRVETLVLSPETAAGLELDFEQMEFRHCRCNCPFCFVDQMPSGLRKSLYVKDEDFRLSFLYGNYTTMNDVTDEEIGKLIRQNNSPQWISVHAVDPDMRRYIFGRPMKRDILDTLLRLAEGGVVIHTQAVVVPGKNDGEYLRETIGKLEALHPNIVSLAVVPVGLTRHRSGLPELRTFSKTEMRETLGQIESFQNRFLSSPRESRFVFAADEWYIGAGQTVPGGPSYEGYPQLDNGVGMIRDFVEEIEEDIGTYGPRGKLAHVQIVTGKSGEHVFETYVFPVLQSAGARSLPRLLVVENELFGPDVTVSGLLSGADIVTAYKKRSGAAAGTRVAFIPPNCLNHDGVTVDDMTVENIGDALGMPVVAPGESLVRSLAGYSEEGERPQ